jgi:hypothetical protein
VGVVEGEAEGNIWAEGKERGRRMKNRPIKWRAPSQFVLN